MEITLLLTANDLLFGLEEIEYFPSKWLNISDFLVVTPDLSLLRTNCNDWSIISSFVDLINSSTEFDSASDRIQRKRGMAGCRSLS